MTRRRDGPLELLPPLDARPRVGTKARCLWLSQLCMVRISIYGEEAEAGEGGTSAIPQLAVGMALGFSGALHGSKSHCAANTCSWDERT